MRVEGMRRGEEAERTKEAGRGRDERCWRGRNAGYKP